MMAALAWQQLAQHADMTAVSGPPLVLLSVLLPASVALKQRVCAQTLHPRVASQAPSSAGASAGAEGERLLRATRAMQLRDYAAAARLLSQEAEEQPGSFLAYDLRAACSLQAGRHEQALDDAMHCTKLNPDW